MSALAHYLERGGIPTVIVSLVREHSAALRPPRALAVPFMLGRPFGVPDDAAFQHRVLRAALRLLERTGGPVHEDYPEDAPPVELEGVEGAACPLPPPKAPAGTGRGAAVTMEIDGLRPWQALARSRRGRSTGGAAGIDVDAAARCLVAWHDRGIVAPWRTGLTAGDAARLAADELKAFYYEARSAQPGRHSHAAIDRWFWHETSAGELLLALRESAASSDDPSVRRLHELGFVPRAIVREQAAR